MNKPSILQRGAFWIPLATLLWLAVWFSLNVDFDPFRPRNYIPSLVTGLTIGLLSGLSPRKAFRSCFLGFFVIWLFLVCVGALWEFSADVALLVIILPLILGSLSGLFGMGSALLRMIALRKEIDVHLKSWEWNLLIGGTSIFADFIFFFGVAVELRLAELYIWTYSVPFLTILLLSLFALGLFTGAFYSAQYKKVRSFLVRLQFISHTLFLFFLLLPSIASNEYPRDLLLALVFSIICATLLFSGAYVGYHLKKRESPAVAE
jgi:hypothetical protein